MVQFRLHFIVLLWGFTGIMGKLISLSAIPLVFWRTLVAMFAIFLFLKITKTPVRVSKRQLWQYLGIGAIIGIHWVLFFASIKVSNVSVALSTLSTGALFAAFLEPLFFHRKINKIEILLAILVSICIGLIFRASPEYGLGIFLGISCAALSALMVVFNGLLQKDSKNRPRVMMFYEMLGAFLVVCFMLPFSINSIQEIAFMNNDWIWILILGIGLTAYPQIESVALMKHISPYSLILAVNLEPIYGIILAYFIFGESEKMSTVFYVASLLMIAVIVFHEVIKFKQKQLVNQ